MLATLVIGLREGLEAALVVGIIAAFLRSNGKSLTAMWLGVALAVVLSIAVGAGLAVLEQTLPQAAQEGLETIIGAIAVVFVTGMIVWMNGHARDMKRQLESEAAQALGRASSYALASMAFLAVLKEGFETSVFLLATFSAAQSATLAAAGAIIGLLVAVIIGWGIYAGSVKLNLSRFFRITAVFLVLVAAGLVVSSLRTAHEAGWLNAGQLAIMNLDWLVAHGTIQSALITGVLGIPADPRLIEVLGWLAYLIPVALYLYWPATHRPGPRASVRLQVLSATALVVLALTLVLAYPTTQPQVPQQATLVAGDPAQRIGSARLTQHEGTTALQLNFTDAPDASLALSSANSQQHRHRGISASAWQIKQTHTPAQAPDTLTLQQVMTLAGGRLPIGLNPRQYPGPFTAHWTIHSATRVWRADNILLDAAGRNITTVALSGGGLQTTRTFTVRNDESRPTIARWQLAPAYTQQVGHTLDQVAVADMERRFWAIRLPVLLIAVATILLGFAWRGFSRLARDKIAAATTDTTTGHRSQNSGTKGASHAA